MSQIHVRQIEAYLKRLFSDKIDLNDLISRQQAEQHLSFLSRSLAAFTIMHLADVSEDEAAQAVTDAFDDNGLDAIHYSPAEHLLILVQSKWRTDGKGTLELGDAQKFVRGVNDLLNLRKDRFNDKVIEKWGTVESAVLDTRTRVLLTASYTGDQSLSVHVKRAFDDLMMETNQPSEILTLRVLRQADLHRAVTLAVAGSPVDVDVQLYDWGMKREPIEAIYGQIAASDIATIWQDHFPRLLAPNIRMFLGTTDVNDSLVNTLYENPEMFWYNNNRITALCATVRKAPVGGDTRESGVFKCIDLRVVNGAQTAGAIASANVNYPDQVAKARVPLRLISLEQVPEGFDREVTRSNNTQNRIQTRDFVALDPNQERIKNELQLEDVAYVYKSGDTLPPTMKGFDLVEATVARACIQTDIQPAVQSKREIGRLWVDIGRPPYSLLFNESVDGLSLWRLVLILRDIEVVLTSLQSSEVGRRRLLAYHGNRFIAHLVLQELPATYFDTVNSYDDSLSRDVHARCRSMFERVILALDAHYPDAYPASLFKNLTRCRHLKNELS